MAKAVEWEPTSDQEGLGASNGMGGIPASQTSVKNPGQSFLLKFPLQLGLSFDLAVKLPDIEGTSQNLLCDSQGEEGSYSSSTCLAIEQCIPSLVSELSV